MSRASLITLIHVAKNKLQLDDDTYRSVLQNATGEISCRKLTVSQLEKVLKTLEEKGFNRQKRSKRRQNTALPESDKIRMIWRNMAEHGFLVDASEAALDHFAERITRLKNGGEGVATLSWLRGEKLLSVLESLKQWHIREMKSSLAAHGVIMPVNPRTGAESRDYGTILSAYNDAAKRWAK